MQKLSKRTIASRANGKLSHGPVSVTGKLRASANSVRHGLLANSLVLDDESKEVFALLHQQYIDRINPTDGIEISLVEELAAIAWRRRRLLAIETNLFNEAAASRVEADVTAAAFSDLSRGPELHLIDRYESRLHRMFQRTLKNIQLIRQIEYTEPSAGELTQLPESTEIHELPNEPRSEQLPVELASYPTTSITDSAQNKGGGDFSIYGLGPSPRSETDGLEVARTSVCARRSLLEINKLQSGLLESLLATEPAVAFQQSPTVPPPTNPKIIEFPNEPRFAQPSVESTASPTTSNPDPNPAWPPFEHTPATGRLTRVA
jgi:hypothetical protein